MRMIRRRTLCLGSATLAALHALAVRAQARSPRVVATFSILADMAQELAPLGVQVTALVGADSDVHVYEPTPADSKRLAQADLVLVNGLRFEGWIERMVEWLGVVPRAQRRVITSHDAFGYFGAAYGVDFLAPQGWNTHSEPSAAAVARLIRQIRRDGVRAIFIENISDARLIQRIASEAGVRVGGTLYSDALSAPGGVADTYLKLFEHNAGSLASALAPGG